MKAPAVTLGMPAYNEEKRLEKSVITLLNQTETDFELLLGDNCSTDGTLDIMKRLAAMDSRIRILTADRNRGAVWNFARLLQEARGEYFAWAGAHDYYDPHWLEILLRTISSDPRIVLAYPQCTRLLPDNTILEITNAPVDTRGMSIKRRVPLLCALSRAGERMYGLYRTAVARQCPVTTVVRWDALFLARLSLFGDVVSLETPLWYRHFDAPPASDHNSLYHALLRQYRLVYPAERRPHALPHFYHLACLLKDGIWASLRGGPERLILTYHMCLAYHRRGRRNLPYEFKYCLQAISRLSGIGALHRKKRMSNAPKPMTNPSKRADLA